MNKTARFAAAGFGLAALIGGASTGVVMAQSSGGATATTTQALADQVAPNGGAFITDLAKNLGISETQLRDALKKTSLDGLDKAVADGKITAAEAATIRTRIESGDGALFGIGGPRGDMGGRGGPGGPGGHDGPGHLWSRRRWPPSSASRRTS